MGPVSLYSLVGSLPLAPSVSLTETPVYREVHERIAKQVRAMPRPAERPAVIERPEPRLRTPRVRVPRKPRVQASRKVYTERTCECGVVFMHWHHARTYCSLPCRSRANRKTVALLTPEQVAKVRATKAAYMRRKRAAWAA